MTIQPHAVWMVALSTLYALPALAQAPSASAPAPPPVLAASVAAATDPAEGLAAELESLRQAGKYSEAVRLAVARAAAFPDEGGVRYLCAFALQQVRQFDAAVGHAERAAALLPDSPEVHRLLSAIERIRGHAREARVALDRALALDPGSPNALALAEELAIEGRIRAGVHAELAAGTPAAAADAFFRSFAARSYGAAIALFDASVFEGIQGAEGKVDRAAFARGLEASLAKAADQSGQTFVGYEVLDDAQRPPADGRAIVQGHVVLEIVMDPANLQRQRRILEAPIAGQVVDDETVAVYRGLDAADRVRFFEGLRGLHVVSVNPISVELRARGPDWRITDVTMGEEPALRLTSYLRSWKDWAHALGTDVPSSSEPSSSLGPMLEQLTGVVILVFVVAAAFYVRGRRARR